jgi:hypothetical protein
MLGLQSAKTRGFIHHGQQPLAWGRLQFLIGHGRSTDVRTQAPTSAAELVCAYTS